MEQNATRMCELLVGLPDITVLGIVDAPDQPLEVHVECRDLDRRCVECGTSGRIKDRDSVELVDLPCFGRPTLLVWRKHRLACVNTACEIRSWTVQDSRIASPRVRLTDRAGRWATEQVGRYARAINDVAVELSTDWHTISAAVVAYGEALLDDDPDRIGTTTALGLDETLFVRLGRFRAKQWCTSIVDVAAGRLLDIVPGRTSTEACRWLADQGSEWCSRIEWATLDLSGPYRAAFDTMTPDAVQVADQFHVIKLANTKLDEVRRRVQNQTLGHRGHRDDPLYRARKLLVMAEERVIDAGGRERLLGLLDAGDPKGEVRTAWSAKELVRDLYSHRDPDVALETVVQLAQDLQDRSCPPEIRQLGRTLGRWKHQIAAWHASHLSNAPTEAANNLVKRVKRGGFGFTKFRNYRVRVLLYAGRPNWSLLPAITPR
ncbi:MAG: ISL3 family transposase [Ilumatobacteraceae bacterium]